MAESTAFREYGPLDGGNYEFGWKSDYLEAHLLSDVGKKRSKNEDSCLMQTPKEPGVLEAKGRLFAVADGMGGASAGEYASRMALQELSNTYYELKAGNVPQALRAALEVANERIFEEAEVNPVYSGMGTTVSAVILHGDWAYIAQVGDSRVYLLREHNGIHQITHDHSLVAEQLRSGLITEEEARNHTLKNLITRAVGIKGSVSVDLFSVQLQQHDTLLICSDGLCNMIEDDEIAQHLSQGSLRDGSRKIVERALDEGGTDNITSLTLRMTSAPPRSVAQEGGELVELKPRGLMDRIKRLFA